MHVISIQDHHNTFWMYRKIEKYKIWQLTLIELQFCEQVCILHDIQGIHNIGSNIASSHLKALHMHMHSFTLLVKVSWERRGIFMVDASIIQ